MTRAYEIATALREFSFWAEYGEDADEQEKMTADLYAAANLIENQQRHIEALMKANASLKDTIPRPRTTRSWRKLRHELQVGRSGVEPPRRLRGHGADAGRHQGIA